MILVHYCALCLYHVVLSNVILIIALFTTSATNSKEAKQRRKKTNNYLTRLQSIYNQLHSRNNMKMTANTITKSQEFILIHIPTLQIITNKKL